MTIMRDELGGLRIDRDVVRATGTEVADFLHGQLSQDVTGLPVGSSASSLLLQPQGKIETYLRISRLREDEFVLDTAAGFGEAMVARLDRFKLRTDATFEPLEWSVVAIRGTGSIEAGSAVPAEIHAPIGWLGTEGVDLIGPDVELPAAVAEVDPSAYEVLRVEAGEPAMGSELTERTIPNEAGIVDRAASFTKGCYVGQELVARIDSRGNNTPRRLLGVVAATDGQLAVGAEIVVNGDVAGSVTSAAYSSSLGAPIGLAYIKRAVEEPAVGECRRADGSALACEIRALPLIG